MLWLVALAFLIVFLVTVPFRTLQLPAIHRFIPVLITLLVLSNAMTAVLLLVQASLLRSRRMLALSSGYLFKGATVVLQSLVMSGALSDDGFLNTDPDIANWMLLVGHAGFPISVMVYSRLERLDDISPLDPWRLSFLVIVGLTLFALSAVGTVILFSPGHDLPSLSPAYLSMVVPVSIGIVAALHLLNKSRSLIDLWLLVILSCWIVELLSILAATSPYSLLWYTGYASGLISGTLLLFVLLACASGVDSQVALSMSAAERDRTKRIVTFGTAATVVAHEVKQPLAAMVNNASAALRWLQREPSDVERAKNLLRTIQSDGLRASEVVEGVRSSCCKFMAQSRPLPVNRLIHEAVAIASPELRSNHVELRLCLEGNLPDIVGDRLQLQQVLLDLISNSIDVMATTSGRSRILTIEANRQPPDHVSILIKDNGPGFDVKDRDKIFEPFFTNKANGTGLGLVISRTIVEAHGGSLHVPTDQVGGAVLQLSFPIAELGEENVRRPAKPNGVRD